jgi:PEP-CTERM motif
MKKLFLSCIFLSLLAAGARAGVVLGTDYPPGTPLMMSAGTTSGPMLVNVVSDNPPNDIMTGWNLQLTVLPDAGANGTVTFQDPATGTPSNPANYIFGGNGLGISVTNGGSVLSAGDFFDPNVGLGAPVPGAPGANLLKMDFLASSNASGLFGVYANEGRGLTQWTDANLTTQFFTNAPDGTGLVRIGEILIPQSVPEPTSLMLAGTAALAVLGLWSRRSVR